MNLKRHHKQTVAWQHKSGQNEYGEDAYDAAVDIKALYRPNTGVRRSMTGDNVEVESYVQTTAAVEVEDTIEGWEVRRIEPIVYRGRIIGREVYL